MKNPLVGRFLGQSVPQAREMGGDVRVQAPTLANGKADMRFNGHTNPFELPANSLPALPGSILAKKSESASEIASDSITIKALAAPAGGATPDQHDSRRFRA